MNLKNCCPERFLRAALLLCRGEIDYLIELVELFLRELVGDNQKGFILDG